MTFPAAAHDVLRGVPDSARDGFVRSVTADDTGLDPASWGRGPSAGDLLGLKKGREWRLPAWQFSAEAAQGSVAGLAEVHRAFPGGVGSLTEWITTPNVEDLRGSSVVQPKLGLPFVSVQR